jgi:hypothetical protein
MRKKIAIGTAICLCAVALSVVVGCGPDELHSKARVQWKDNALAQIAKDTSDSADILEAMKKDAWLFDGLIVMTNGEWMVYRSICKKEDDRIEDIFLGRGSDGRWYYSTWHFCFDLQNLSIHGQPGSLTVFSNNYYLKEFDGHSDECLKDTKIPWNRKWIGPTFPQRN